MKFINIKAFYFVLALSLIFLVKCKSVDTVDFKTPVDTKLTELINKIKTSIDNSETVIKKISTRCCICFDRNVECCILPCKHSIICYQCYLKLQEQNEPICPICRVAIKECVKLDDKSISTKLDIKNMY